MENRIYQLEEVIAGLKTEVTDLINANDNAEKDIQDLKNQIGAVNKEKSNLQSKLSNQLAETKRIQQDFQHKKAEMLASFQKKSLQQSN